MPSILISLRPDYMDVSQLEKVEQIASGYDIIFGEDNLEENSLDDVEILFAEANFKLINKIPNLKWYQQAGAGAEWALNHPIMLKPDFVLTSASGVHAIPVSEQILAFIFGFARGLKPFTLGQHYKIWTTPKQEIFFEVNGKRVLLVGVGTIGKYFAKCASALGMEVVGVRRKNYELVDGVSRMITFEQIDDELPETDILVLTMPLTNETKGMFDYKRLKLLKRGACIINVSRGGTIVEQDLISLLNENHVAFAGLDVFETEPLPKTSPLWDSEKVIITPHCSGVSPKYSERLWPIFIRNLEHYINQEPLTNIISRDSGY